MFTSTFSIVALKAPDVRFLVASKEYANDTLVLVNVSILEPDSVQWNFPPQTLVYKTDRDSAWIAYADTGSYPVEMTAFYQNCPFSVSKDLQVTPKDTSKTDPGSEKEILSFTASPNPTSGQIHIAINLNTDHRYLQLKLVDALGADLWQTTAHDVRNYTTDVNVLQNAAAGTYFLIAVTETEYEKLVIVKQ